jgi:hypothetical protein
MKNLAKILALLFIMITVIYSCDNEDDSNTNEEPLNEEIRVGFELVQIVSVDSILVWTNADMLTQEQFDAIELSDSWIKNEPREGMPNFAKFLRSPDANQEGDFTTAEHFGYNWLFNAQVVESDVALPDNEQGLLTGRYIAKYHEVTFNTGSTLSVLISPDGEEYILISRDVNRLTDIPIIPDNWELEERVISEDLILELPNPTLNIRAENNQDSWQGPVEF